MSGMSSLTIFIDGDHGIPEAIGHICNDPSCNLCRDGHIFQGLPEARTLSFDVIQTGQTEEP